MNTPTYTDVRETIRRFPSKEFQSQLLISPSYIHTLNCLEGFASMLKQRASVWRENPGFVLTPLDVRTKEITCIMKG